MAKGSTGVSMGGSIEYRHQLKPTTQNCRNCKYYKKAEDFGSYRNISVPCSKFGISITDTSNAKNCVGFENRHTAKKHHGGLHGTKRKKI